MIVVNPICGEVENIQKVGGFQQHHPLLSTQNHCETPKMFFAFQIGHIEKSQNLGVFGGHFGGLRADLGEVLNIPPPQIE